jgi:hypothetical protein
MRYLDWSAMMMTSRMTYGEVILLGSHRCAGSWRPRPDRWIYGGVISRRGSSCCLLSRIYGSMDPSTPHNMPRPS